MEIADSRIKPVAGYILGGWHPTGSQCRRAWTLGRNALEATFIEGQSNQMWERQALRYVRKNMFSFNPQSNIDRIKLARQLVGDDR